MNGILESINEPNAIKGVDPKDYQTLAREIRRFLVQSISHTGGHLASNLGVVELTMALHLCCDFPEDKIVWDVGHQCYTHKLLTGRREEFAHLRQFGGISGFPKRKESDCDVLDTGHSSTSIGAALGLAKARDILGKQQKIFAVIGDGALSGGMAYEAMNNAARLKSNLIIVLNDNQMSISKNVGGMSNYLGKIRTNRNYTDLKEIVEGILKKLPGVGIMLTDRIRGAKDILKRLLIPGMLFEDMGLTYIGPINGHDIIQLKTAFDSATKLKSAVIVHVITQKGKGYPPAQKDPSSFHGVAPFHIKDGSPRKHEKKRKSYTEIFSRTMTEEAALRQNLVAISAAMPAGTGLTDFAAKYPKRFFDVGIAEEHAVTFAAGLAAGEMHPVVAVYSTFLQRAYDQIIHDVCLNKLPVTFAIDRAGLVGSDGETHQGIFDIAYLMQMPEMLVMAPKNTWELQAMLKFSLDYHGPSAVRYPRGEAFCGLIEYTEPIEPGKSEWIYRESQIALLAVGSMVETALEVREILKKQGFSVSLVNVRFIKPVDEALLNELPKNHSVVITMEEGVYTGGFGQSIAARYQGCNTVAVHAVALPDQFIEHGSVKLLKEKYQLNAAGIAAKIDPWLRKQLWQELMG